ncbi:neutral alpha-glucosidase AB isoform X2 [Aplysia californica]|uniref:Glucosidase II subunit alpha n=1 Tax=Aplysia californica TaxID=6500 RepID=A0ABM1A4L8_APLCA|nr:neutral alpha-glucosidase AB isoform X2 [Aplysia californica]
MKHLCLMLGVLLCTCLGVHRENFRTCSQSGFCKRQRNMEPGTSSYVVQPSTLRISSSSLMVEVLNTKNNIRFLLQGYGLQHGIFRVKLAEAEALRERYEIPVGLTLVAEPVQEELKYHGEKDGKLTFSLGQNKMVINVNPLRLDFLINDEPVTSLNAQGLLKFEHSRTKEEAKDEGAGEESEGEQKEEGEEVKAEEEEEPDMWEETFKGFTDSKPNGPVSVGLDIAFPGFRYVYGIPEHADTFALKTTKNTDPYRLYNLDVFEYELNSPMALYGHIPFMAAHNEKNTVGVFFQNAAEGWVDIHSNVADKSVFSNLADFVTGNNEVPQTDTHWFFEDGIIDIFVLLGPGPRDIFKQYASLTGNTPLPPLWSLAYHQCRWNYNDQDDVRNVDQTMDKFDIPFDVIWLDIEHTDSKKYFTWDGSRFSNSIEMLRNLSSKGRRMVTIVDPHLKREDGYRVYSDARDKGLLVKNKDGNDFDGWCWPGSSSWPDFMEKHVRDWWADQFALDKYVGTADNLFVWNDMNEPSVFNAPEITFPKDVKHLSGRENREVHNLFGKLVHDATFDGLLKRSNYQERPFVLTRAFFAGSQRTSAVWTGDNMGEWSHLKMTVPMMLSLNLAGIHFSGADVGGFFKNPDNELLTRWYQAGVFQPFFRAHAHIDTKRREPYLLPEAYMVVAREAIKKRYTYLPFWYQLFHESETTGMPVMRAIWMEYPKETNVFAMDDEYLLGDAILVKPVVDQGQTDIAVYFPGENTVWYDIDTYKTYPGRQEANVEAPLSKLPAFQRGGSIVPRKMRGRRAASLMYNDPFTLIVCLDKQGKAGGQLYFDDYHSYGYRNGQYALTELSFHNFKLENSVKFKGEGFTTKEWLERVVVAGVNTEPKKIHLVKPDGTKMELGHTYDAQSKVLTIRKPGVNVAEKWIINLH